VPGTMTTAAVREKLIALSAGPLRSMTAGKRLAHPVWKLLTFSLGDEAILPKRAFAISMEPACLSCASGSRIFSRIKVAGARGYPFEEGKYPSPQALAATVSLAQRELRALRSEVTLSIPRAWALTRTVTLPLTVKENLASVVSYELDRLTPFSADGALYDFHLLPASDEKLHLSLIAARADLVTPYLEALGEKGITVTSVSVAHSGLATLARFVGQGPDPCFVSLTATKYEAGLLTDGTLASVFSGSLDTVHEDLSRACSGRRIVATGEAVPLAALKGALPAVLDLNDALPPALRVGSPIACGSVLEALWPHARGFNLLRKGAREKARVPIVLTLVLAIALFAIGVLYVVTPLKLEEQRLEAIDRRVASLKGEVKKVEALKKEVEGAEAEISTIENLKKGKPMTLALIKELTTLLPKSAWLTRVRITEATVEIDGYAATATDLLPKLESSPLLKKVEFASPTFRDVRLNADRFVIKMEIEGLPHGK
jgi:Tfp pilus assembly protein PilN